MDRRRLTAERQARIEEICQGALDREASSRSAFLTEACADAPELREEVESLLAHERSSADFIEGSALDAAAEALSTQHRPGEHIGPYEVVSILGSGGMGDVYRARDHRLGRDVAIKVLPTLFHADHERLARFDREARVLASMNHPSIAAIYGVERDASGTPALVLELVEGPTLEKHLQRSRTSTRARLAVPDALAIASQIATALEVAHSKGVVHRDLKPANVAITSSGTVKVLDFGLAKIVEPLSSAEQRVDDESTTSQVTDARAEGIRGTPAYMSPEQVRGRPIDKRTDVWAFGCVLFEMLAGRRPFDGDSAAETLASVLQREPEWGALPAETPAPIRTLVQRCLRKDPTNRLHDIADARIEIDDCGLAATTTPATPRTRGPGWFPALVIAVASLAAIAVVRDRSARPEPFEFPVGPPEHATFPARYGGFAVAPDGRHIVVTASSDNGASLWVRPIGMPQFRQLPGTDGALYPFWKPDGLEIGFFAGGKLRTVPVGGGMPSVICDAPQLAQGFGYDAVGGTWNRDGTIVFMSRAFTLQKVSATSGSTPVPITRLGDGEIAHRWPSFLPDGQRFLYLALKQPGERGDLRIGSLNGAPSISLGIVESNAVYSAGHLIFLSGGDLVARQFDARTGRMTGPSFPLATTPNFTTWNMLGAFSASASGVLAYHPGGPIVSEQRLTWRDRTGRARGVVGQVGRFPTLDLSPDDTRAAVSFVTAGKASDIWIIDLERGDAVPLTSDPAWEFDPSWSRDGTRIVFNSNRTGGRFHLFSRAADGSGQDALLVTAQSDGETPVWAPRDRFIVYGDDGDVWIRPLEGSRQSSVVWKTQSRERAAALSPDARWIAYTSDRTGRPEIYVRGFPSGDAEHKVSLDGGVAPRWRGDGKEIFFLSPDASMMAARVESANGFKASIPETLFPTGLALINLRPYAVTRDGQRFLIPMAVDGGGSPPITVTTNWHAKLPK